MPGITMFLLLYELCSCSGHLAVKIFISILTMDTKYLREYQYWRSCERINIDEVGND